MSVSVLIPYHEPDDATWRSELCDYTVGWWQENFVGFDIIFGTTDAPFNRSRARNNARRHSTGSVLIVADADTIPKPDAIWAAVDVVREGGAPWVIPYGVDRYYNLSETATARLIGREVIERNEHGYSIPEPTDPDDWEHKITSTAGCLVLSAQAWELAGGYDERFRGWGYEDNAFQLALDRMAGKHQRAEGHICHLWHPAPESARFGQPDIGHNRALFRRYEKAMASKTRMGDLITEHRAAREW